MALQPLRRPRHHLPELPEDGEEIAPRPVPSVQTRAGRWWERHPNLLRSLAVLALAWTTAYLVWRIGWSRSGTSLVLWLALLAAELFGLWSLAMLAWFSWQMPRIVRPRATPGRLVDVYVCTFNEPEAVVRATLTGCRALRYPHTTWLLDDGGRPEMAALAAELGARYLSREDNSHAKAGNINDALRRTDGDLVFVLDADHVPLPDALDALVGYFDDPAMAIVQSPHDFFNHDSVQHYAPFRHEQSVFFHVVLPGKQRHGAAFWCGSAALLRRSALLEVGGVAVETIAEDFHTTMKLHRAGWASRYHDEILVQGVAPHDLASYLLQRDRWARGNLSVFHTPESPLRPRGFTFRQRLSYLASLSGYLAGPVRGLLLAILALVLWTGALPLAASAWALATLWAPATLLGVLAGAALARGHMTARESFHFELSVMEIHLRALRCLIRPGRAAFKVTPKEGVDAGGAQSLRQLRMAVGLAAALGLGLLARALAPLGLPLPALPGIALVVVPALALFECYRIVRSLAILAGHRQRRETYRFPCAVRAELRMKGRPLTRSTILDLNQRGAHLRVLQAAVPVEAVREGAELVLTSVLPMADGSSQPVTTTCVIREARVSGISWHLGVQFVGLSASAQHTITEYCHVVRPMEDHRRPLPPPVPLGSSAPVQTVRALPLPSLAPEVTEAASVASVA